MCASTSSNRRLVQMSAPRATTSSTGRSAIAARNAALIAPTLVPTITRGRSPRASSAGSSAASAPSSYAPRAPPPASTRPTCSPADPALPTMRAQPTTGRRCDASAGQPPCAFRAAAARREPDRTPSRRIAAHAPWAPPACSPPDRGGDRMGNRHRTVARLIVVVLAAVALVAALAVPAGAHGRGHAYGHGHGHVTKHHYGDRGHHRQGKPITVMTRNLYLGADLTRAVAVIGLPPEEQARAFVAANTTVRAIVDQTNFPLRAK